MEDLKFYIQERYNENGDSVKEFTNMVDCLYIPISNKTTANINDIINPVEGCLVWDTDLKVHKTWNGTEWRIIQN